YLGQDGQLHNKLIVAKILREHSEREWIRKKFEEECKALARIRHPGVVGVLDQGKTDEGIPFLVMEFVEGGTLYSAIKQGGMDLRRVGRLIRQMAEALQAAHDQGVWHRDLKPSNIILRDLGHGQEMAVIIDFGVAIVKDWSTGGGRATRIAGSFPYMA